DPGCAPEDQERLGKSAPGSCPGGGTGRLDMTPFHLAGLDAFPPARRTVADMLEQQADAFGDLPLFICGSARWTYRETRDIAAATAGILGAAGLVRGDRIAILCRNRAELLQFVLGCAWSGTVAVPINASSRGMQLEHMLVNSGAR